MSLRGVRDGGWLLFTATAHSVAYSSLFWPPSHTWHDWRIAGCTFEYKSSLNAGPALQLQPEIALRLRACVATFRARVRTEPRGFPCNPHTHSTICRGPRATVHRLRLYMPRHTTKVHDLSVRGLAATPLNLPPSTGNGRAVVTIACPMQFDSQGCLEASTCQDPPAPTQIC